MFGKALLKFSHYEVVELKDLGDTLSKLETEYGLSVELIGSNERATTKFASKTITRFKERKSMNNNDIQERAAIEIESKDHCYNDFHQK